MRAAPEREPAGPRMNEDIRVREVRLIDHTGTNVGVVATTDALAKAVEAGLDLVEISPDANPPVAKILDYGKYKYQEQKKAAEARKKQKDGEIKEIKMRPTESPGRRTRSQAASFPALGPGSPLCALRPG